MREHLRALSRLPELSEDYRNLETLLHQLESRWSALERGTYDRLEGLVETTKLSKEIHEILNRLTISKEEMQLEADGLHELLQLITIVKAKVDDALVNWNFTAKLYRRAEVALSKHVDSRARMEAQIAETWGMLHPPSEVPYHIDPGILAIPCLSSVQVPRNFHDAGPAQLQHTTDEGVRPQQLYSRRSPAYTDRIWNET